MPELRSRKATILAGLRTGVTQAVNEREGVPVWSRWSVYGRFVYDRFGLLDVPADYAVWVQKSREEVHVLGHNSEGAELAMAGRQAGCHGLGADDDFHHQRGGLPSDEEEGPNDSISFLSHIFSVQKQEMSLKF